MDGDFGVDEFGREYFVVEAPRGRLGISLGENEHAFVVIRGLDTLSSFDMEAWDEVDRRRVQLMRQCVQVGDRIVAIEGQDVVHCSLQEIITRLSKLGAMNRRLTLARYHETVFNTRKYDVEKLVLARVPSGPLGLLINECIPYGAFVEGFQRLVDGSSTKLASHPKIHRGCQIINVNGDDVSGLSREDVVKVLASLKDQEKEVVFYRATGSSCTSIFSVDSSVSERHLGFTVDENESMRCVISSVGPRGDPMIGLGDVLIGVNTTDITTMTRKDAIALVKDTPLPRQLYFARSHDGDIPECHAVRLGPGSLGVNLDGEMRDCARITGFTTAEDNARPEFEACSRFVPGSYILSIGSLLVVDHDLAAISSLLVKMKQTSKTILIGNKVLLDILRGQSAHAKIWVPKGPLGINFSGGNTDSATISGFYPVDGTIGAIESSGKVPVGAVLQRINALNVSCLPLALVTSLLKKLSDVPKQLVFHRGDSLQDINTRAIDVRVPAGPLGIDLKRSIANKVIVDKLNSDPSRGSTRVYEHGGVVEGSEIVAIDGFDVSKLEIGEVLDLLKLLTNHEKVITFSTTRTAYETMLYPANRPGVVQIELPGNTSLPFNTEVVDQAQLACDVQVVPAGNRLIGIENVDVRCLSLQQITATMASLQNAAQVCVLFDTSTGGRASSPSKSRLPNAVSSQNVSAGDSKFPTSVSLQNLQIDVGSQSRQSVSSTDLLAGTDAPRQSPPPSPPRGKSLRFAEQIDDREFIPTVPTPKNSNPPAPLTASSSLARLAIRTIETTSSATASAKLESEKMQSQPPSNPHKIEFLINMASWTGSRSLYRLVLDLAALQLEISPVKATSPRPGSKTNGVTSIHLSDISAMDCGRASSGGSTSPQRPSLFRSASATLNADGSERATVVLTTANRKTVEFDMRSVGERAAFAAHLQRLAPALQPSASF